MTITDRTAPRAVQDCPPPTEPDGWKQADALCPAGFEDPKDAIEWAWSLEFRARYLRRGAAAALVDQGRDVSAAAGAAGISVEELQDYVDSQRRTRQRLEYSQAYYARYPDRTPGQYYPVDDSDPELPADTGFGTRTRRTP